LLPGNPVPVLRSALALVVGHVFASPIRSVAETS
jgi:hypothetical protein